MNDLMPGEIVDITIKGVRNVGHPSQRLVRIADEHGDTYDMPPQAKVERVAPAQWPPRPGDLWRDRHGSAWFAVDVHDIDKTDTPEIVMVYQYEDYRKTPDQLLQANGPMVILWRDQDDTDQFGCDAVSSAGHAKGCPLGDEVAPC